MSRKFPLALRTQQVEKLLARFQAGLARAVLEGRPDDLDALDMLGHALNRLGNHEEALIVDRKLVEHLPESCVAHYNLACSLARTGRVEEALAELKRAVELGYDEAEFMSKDPDLEPIRSHPSYMEILGSIKPPRRADG